MFKLNYEKNINYEILLNKTNINCFLIKLFVKEIVNYFRFTFS